MRLLLGGEWVAGRTRLGLVQEGRRRERGLLDLVVLLLMELLLRSVGRDRLQVSRRRLGRERRLSASGRHRVDGARRS